MMSRRMKALLMSPLVVLIAAATRLIVISNGDTTVASSIARAGGVTGSLLGTVIPLLPPYLPLLVLIFVLYRRLVLAAVIAFAALLVSPAYGSASDGWNHVVTIVPRLSAQVWNGEWKALLRDATGVSVCVAAGVMLAVWGISEVRPRNDRFLNLFLGQVRYIGFGLFCGAICTFGLLFSAVVYRVPFDVQNAAQIMRRPWLPAEEIRTNEGKVIVGFVISSADGWFLVMAEDDRALRYVKADSVAERLVCTPPSYDVEYRTPLIELRGAGKPMDRVCGRSARN